MKAKAKAKKQVRKRRILILTVGGVMAAALAAIVAANWTFISDIVVGMRYQPTAEMQEISEALELTNQGQRIFNASAPELMEKEDFNQKCREQSNESAILGCYTEQRIYVYDIDDEELAGIRELTTAHELLHAVYLRLSDGERQHLGAILTNVYRQNAERLKPELGVYAEGQRAEELYVRAGTEIRDLPEELERHFATVFKNQDRIVDFYESYIAVFEEIERTMQELLQRINESDAEIEAKIADYEARMAQLNTEAEEFNACARTENCFSSMAAFYARQAELLGEQGNLKALYAEINAMIDQHNLLVAKYNENVLHGQTLNQVINSSDEVNLP